MASRTPTFKEFWAAYPLHRDRLRAEKAWLRMTAADKAAAIAALPAYTADCRQRGVSFQYAQGWLNGRRWEDEMEPEAPVQGSRFFASKANKFERKVTAEQKRGIPPQNSPISSTSLLTPPPHRWRTWRRGDTEY